MSDGARRRVALIGTGLIGASIGLAVRKTGATVVAFDREREHAERALAAGAVDEIADSIADAVADADVTFVAVHVGQVAPVVADALSAGARAVTDVGSVKAAVVADVVAASGADATRFVGGHPMAGSEQEGIEGATADLFVGATWVLTPTEQTDHEAFVAVRGLVADLGAEVLAVTPEHHDALVAIVSHVPQLAATTLMDFATHETEERSTLLRLAAGGFRDMTRIAAGAPGIWPDICIANRDAIVAALDDYRGALDRVRDLVAEGDRNGLLELLERARAARRSLPVGAPAPTSLVELRVRVADRPGVLAEVTTLAGSLGVNIYDVEIAHSAEGGGGVLVLVVPEAGSGALEAALVDRGYHASGTRLP
jgi:prephenate dehydrogenase